MHADTCIISHTLTEQFVKISKYAAEYSLHYYCKRKKYSKKLHTIAKSTNYAARYGFLFASSVRNININFWQCSLSKQNNGSVISTSRTMGQADENYFKPYLSRRINREIIGWMRQMESPET